MSEPITTAAELGVYLGNPDLDLERAEYILALAQSLCETILSPLPAAANVVVLAVAARAFNNVTSAHQVGLGSAQIAYGSQGSAMGIGGLYLSRADKATLRRLGGRSGAFSIDLLPDPWPPVDELTDPVMDGGSP